MNLTATDNELLADPLNESNFHRIKIGLFNRKGQSYSEFKKTLTPVYSKVWMHMAWGWSSLIIVMVLSGWLLTRVDSVGPAILICILCSAIAGYIIAYLVNFFHEAAHYNLSPDKKRNERIANTVIGLLIGQSIGYYRLVHWEHHKSLGTTEDTERSYFESPDWKFLLTSVTAIRPLKLILLRDEFITRDTEKFTNKIRSGAGIQLMLGIVFHLAILGGMYLLQQWWLMAAWVLALGCWYPLFGSLRQVLEHRSEEATKVTDYSKQPHGKLTRIFGNSLFERTFGGAGFNKHLLHHLEPQISYTRLNDLEAFLSETDIGHHINKKRSSYFKTFLKLFNR